MTSAERLRKVRGTVRASVSRNITLLAGLLQNPDTEAREVNRQVAVLKTNEVELRQLDKDILDLTEDEAIEGEVEGSIDYHDKILESSKSGPNGDRVAATQSNIGSAEAPQGPISTPRYPSVTLPTLHVTTYAGDLRQWQEFWDCYSATIYNNTELPPIEKFKYLLTYLTGAAKRAIEGIRPADHNYDIAVKTLKERFGGQEFLVNEHIDQVLALSPVRSSKEVEKLRILHDTVRFRVEVREEGEQEAPSSHPRHSTMVSDDMGLPTRPAQGIPSASALAAAVFLQQRTPSGILCNSRAHSLA
ncbi:uncharacterized protein LOC119394701 [Rhipicephalus sanguineus]|uniref:uncharacterized protein LOC119394701 n=1 Tax=Rhipicephalus sanguineus TaxID=34632 RepID=UPI001894C61C|nr:uncharacterized protein LOC119394701 [Rhipicephalus sanguineus]